MPVDQYPQAELLSDRLKHALVFVEAATRAIQETLELLEGPEEQEEA